MINSLARHATVAVPAARRVIGLDHFPQAFTWQGGVGSRAVRQSLREESLGQRVLLHSPTFADVVELLGGDDAPSRLAQLIRGYLPTGDAAEQIGALGVEIGEDAAQ